MTPTEISDKTYKWDRIRGSFSGAIDACWHTFALLIAIRVFNAPIEIKRNIPAAYPIGALFAPFTLILISRLKLKAGSGCALYLTVSAFCLAIAAFSANLYLYTFFMMLALMSVAQCAPLTTQIYANNYNSAIRGKRLSSTILISGIVVAAFSYTGGRLLDINLQYFRLVLLLCSCMALGAAFAVFKIPTEKLHPESTVNPLKNINLIFKDKMFGQLILCWSIMGMGNLMMIPMRFEYMTNPIYNVNASNETIGLVLGAIPVFFSLLSTKFWGILFDKLNLIVIQIMTNSILLFAILIFFFTSKIWVMGFSMMLFGFSMGGFSIIWQLWVTKIAHREKVSAYMSIHSGSTGVRGLVAPYVAYSLMAKTHPVFVGWVALTLVGLATILFIPLRGIVGKRNVSTQ